jgi:hypothetical protein
MAAMTTGLAPLLRADPVSFWAPRFDGIAALLSLAG